MSHLGKVSATLCGVHSPIWGVSVCVCVAPTVIGGHAIQARGKSTESIALFLKVPLENDGHGQTYNDLCGGVEVRFTGDAGEGGGVAGV